MRLIDADALKAALDAEEITFPMLDDAPTIDAVPVDKFVCKISRGDFIVYRREWLYVHLEQEFEILKEVRGWAERKEE